MKPVYIQSSSVVAPQNCEEASFLNPIIRSNHLRMTAMEPEYSRFIPPLTLRRMSRVLKMAIFAGMDCLHQAGLKTPDGIIAGTGRGSLTDTEIFLKDIEKYQEQALTPTPFILSTYNSVCGTLALQTGATGYNQTFVHRAHSFEHALLNAQMELNREQQEKHYLVGAFDETTEDYLIVKGHLHYWKKNFQPERSLLEQQNTPGSAPGEGAGFFLISNHKKSGNPAILDITTFEESVPSHISENLDQFLNKNNLSIQDIDLLVLGLNGDKQDQPLYNHFLERFSENIPVMAFKHLCGEFETAGLFGLKLICRLAEGKTLPKEVWYRAPSFSDRPKTLLFYNVFRASDQSFMLLEF